jgi:hypothetical protein
VALESWRRWNLAARGLHALYHGSNTISTQAPYLGSRIHGPDTQVDFGRTFKPALAAILPWVSNRWLRYSSPLRWHKSTLTVAPKPTPVAQADFGRNLKPAPMAKLFVFSDFLFTLAFRKVLFIFFILRPPRMAQSRLL